MKTIHLYAKINDGESFEIGTYEIPDDADPEEYQVFKVEVDCTGQPDFTLESLVIERGP